MVKNNIKMFNNLFLTPQDIVKLYSKPRTKKRA